MLTGPVGAGNANEGWLRYRTRAARSGRQPSQAERRVPSEVDLRFPSGSLRDAKPNAEPDLEPAQNRIQETGADAHADILHELERLVEEDDGKEASDEVYA